MNLKKNDLNLMKTVEIPKDKMNKSLKEIKEMTNKNQRK